MAGFSLFLTVLVAAAEPAQTEPADPSLFAGIPNIVYEYYDVEGRTPAEIYGSMRARAPTGGTSVAATRWHIRAGWQETWRGKTCFVDSPLTKLSIRIIFPRLVVRDDQSEESLAFWKRARRGLELHESGHAHIAFDHRNDFTKAAQNLRCDQVRAVAAKTQKRIEKIQAAYDRKTNHGTAQIPPAGE